MKTKDYLIAALAPTPVLLLALYGNHHIEGWNWNPGSFVFAWAVIGGATLLYRFLATRTFSSLAYRLGAGLAILTGFVIFWTSAAVQIIGEENPANPLYVLTLLAGLIAAGFARFRPAPLAWIAFATAGATFLIPVVALALWPTDFSPGVPQVFALNFGFVVLFATAGALFRRSVARPAGS